MKKKIVSILVCTLFIVVAVLPVISDMRFAARPVGAANTMFGV